MMHFFKRLVCCCTAALLTVASMQAVPLSALAADDTAAILGDTTVTWNDTDWQLPAVASNANSGFLFGDQLDPNNTACYQEMVQYLQNPSDTGVVVSLPEPIVLQCSSRTISKWSEEEQNAYYAAVIQAVMPGVVVCTLDYPELFWIDYADVACNVPDNGMSYKTNFFAEKKYTITISKIIVSPRYDLSSYQSFSEVLETRDALQQIVADYPISGDSDYEKCQSIYQSLVDLVSYDPSASRINSIAGALCPPHAAVCEGYAKAFKILCDREQIPCLAVLGNYSAASLTAHMWNYVYLDGAWYGVDPTWGDSSSFDYYFMRGSEVFQRNHTPESPYSILTLSFPELSPEDYVPAVTSTTTAATTTTTSTTTATTVTTTETTAAVSGSGTTAPDATTTTITETTTAMVPLSGDVNQDGSRSLLDAILLRKYLVCLADSTQIDWTAADCNQDHCVNIFDAVLLLRWLSI